jgi:hypothetical protein
MQSTASGVCNVCGMLVHWSSTGWDTLTHLVRSGSDQSELDRVKSVSAPRPGRFTPGKNPVPIVQEAG